MKAKELKVLTPNELNDKLKELRLELMKENAQVAVGTVPKSPGKLRATRRTIARIHTVLGQKKEAPKQQ